MKRTIYDMKLHETMSIGDNYSVLRVAGGWIYRTVRGDTPALTFVPYHSEFQNKEKTV